METKFIIALLEACDTPEEVDWVFELAKIESFEVRCAYLKETDVTYFDIPNEPQAAYNTLKLMYTERHTKFMRVKRKVKEFIMNNF